MVYIAKGWELPVSPEEKYWASVEYTFPDFLPLQGELWTSFSYTYQGKTWDSLSDIEDSHSEDPEVRAAAQEFLLPEWKSGTVQVGFSSDNHWDLTFVVRNVFDDDGINWLSGTDRGAAFAAEGTTPRGRPRPSGRPPALLHDGPQVDAPTAGRASRDLGRVPVGRADARPVGAVRPPRAGVSLNTSRTAQTSSGSQ